MDKKELAFLWEQIPIGRENAFDYIGLCSLWSTDKRSVRAILHELQCYDSGDNYILIRSSRGKGFYKTDNIDEIKAYKKECLSKGKSILAPIAKMNRVIGQQGDTQYRLDNNLRAVRESVGLKQKEVCVQMRKYDKQFDCALLSKMENDVALPTPYQLSKLANIYGVAPSALMAFDFMGV